MCDQTEVSYLPDDVVWVKLGSVWWPAQVQDETKLSDDVTSGLRKKPLAVVKFFDEDLFEFPKNLTQIYHYNCFKKDEFIKKGLDLCRPSGYREISQNMKKFPMDIRKAEVLTGGNPDIIYDPKYQPEEKFDYREQFGMKPRKKSSAGTKRNSTDSVYETPKQTKVKFSTPLSAPSTSRTPERSISTTTKAHSTSVRAKKKKISETAGKRNETHEYKNNQFSCCYCDYTCGRMDVVVEHYKGHYSGKVTPPPTHIPHNYYKVFQGNFMKCKSKATSSPIAVPKYKFEKTSAKRKLVEESTPIKKRKSVSVMKDKAQAASLSGSSLAVVDIVGASASPKKRSRKSKETKVMTVKENEALDILKDWEEDLEDETDMKLSNSESVDNLKDSSINKSNSLVENEGTSNTPPSQEQKTPVLKEKCCFDFEDNDESLSLNKSLKFGQKLPRVISEEKPNVQRLLKELKESQESTAREEPANEDFSQEFENLLQTTEVPQLPDIPLPSLVKPNDTLFKKDSLNLEVDVEKIEKKELEKISLEETENKSQDLGLVTQLIVSQENIEPNEIFETPTISENNCFKECSNQLKDYENCIAEKKQDGLPTTINEENTTASTIGNVSTLSMLSDNVSLNISMETKNDSETKHNILDISIQNELKIEALENNEQLSVSHNINDEDVVALTSKSIDPSLETPFEDTYLDKGETKYVFEKISESGEILEVSPSEENISDMSIIVDKSIEVDNCQESITCQTESEEIVIESSNDNTHSAERELASDLKKITESEEVLKNSHELKVVETRAAFNKSSVDDGININIIDDAEKCSKEIHLPSKEEQDIKDEQNLATNLQPSVDQIPFDINSMPIVIDQDPIMEIVEGHVEPLPNEDVVRLYIRNRGEEEPEDFRSPRRLLTVSPPPPNMPSVAGVKKITIPPPKNKNAANGSSKSSASSSSTRFNLSKPSTFTPQQPKIFVIKSTTGGPDKLLIPQNQSNLITSSGKLQPGTRILTSSAQLITKGPAQQKVASKQVIIGKQGFPTTAKVVQSVISPVFQKIPSPTLIGNKTTSTVLNAPKIVVSRAGGRNVSLATPQLKNLTAVPISPSGAKVVRSTQVVKSQGNVFQTETVQPQKPVVQSTSAINETKKQSMKNKQPSPNILQKAQRKPARQQKSQILTIPAAVQQQSAEVVTVSNLPIVQSISTHSSAEPVKMLYLTVDNSQYSVENSVIPVENDRNIFVTSTPSSGSMDSIIFSIDGTGNLVNISNQASSNSSHTPSQDILAKALANTQVLQSETADIVDSENSVYVDQQYPAPSLSNAVLETSLTLNQPPIMTPLEVPSSVAPKTNISHIIPVSNIAKRSDIQQPSMPLLTDEVEMPGQAVFLSDSSVIPSTSGHLTFQLVHDNSLVVTSGLVQGKPSKPLTEGKQEFLNTESKEENVLPEFLKGNFVNKSEISKNNTSSSER